MSSEFKRAFRASKETSIEVDSLTNIKQQPGESLKTYLSRFTKVAARARDVDDSSKLMAVRTGIMVGGYLWHDL